MGNIPPSFFQDTAVYLNVAYTKALQKVTATFPVKATYTDIPQNKMEYDRALQALEEVEQSYGIFKSTLLRSMEAADATLKDIDYNTTVVADANERLKAETYDIVGPAQAADGALSDSQLLYNQQLVVNVLLLVIMAGACVLYYKTDTVQYSDIRKSLLRFSLLCAVTLWIVKKQLGKVWFWLSHLQLNIFQRRRM